MTSLTSRVRWRRNVVARITALGFFAASLVVAFVPSPAQAEHENPPYPVGSECVIEAVPSSGGTVDSVPPPMDCFDADGFGQDGFQPSTDDLRWLFFIPPYNTYRFLTHGEHFFAEDLEPGTDDGDLVSAGPNKVSVTVYAWDNGATSSGPVGFSKTAYRMTFDTGTYNYPVANGYSLKFDPAEKNWAGECFRRTTFEALNVADPGQLFIYSVFPRITSRTPGLADPPDNSERASWIMDGTPGTTQIVTFNDDLPGLRCGAKYHIEVLVSDRGVAGTPGSNSYNVADWDFTVEPEEPGTGGGGSKYVKPKAKLYRTGAHRVKVELYKGSRPKTWFREIKNPPGPKNTKVKAHKVTTHKKVFKRGKLRYGTIVTIKAYFKKNGKWGWFTLKRLKIRRIGS